MVIEDKCKEFIARIAKLRGVSYSLTPSPSNETALCMLWDACLRGAEIKELKKYCIAVLEASTLSTLQGLPVPSFTAEEVEDFELLFFCPAIKATMQDKPYVPPEQKQLQIEYTLRTDGDTDLRLTPGVQLSLLDLLED